MPERNTRSIGGYFELELPRNRTLPYHGVMKFQSARAAFLALLQAGRPKRVWMPRYICDAMLAPLQSTKVKCVWYDLDEKLAVDSKVQIEAGDWLVYVNYYGLHQKNIENLLLRYSPDQIVLDFSQSFFEPPVESALATIYSPRKFFGVPDGGLLISKSMAISAVLQDVKSLERSSHLMKRLADSPEAGYQDYLYAEKTLSDCEPKLMSKLTERLLGSIDFDDARRVRNENFMFLHQELGKNNQYEIDALNDVAPLCYPFMTSNPNLKQTMIANRIFVPTYWTDAIARVGEKWAEKMVNNLLPLPIDQRYGREDMEKIVSVISGGK